MPALNVETGKLAVTSTTVRFTPLTICVVTDFIALFSPACGLFAPPPPIATVPSDVAPSKNCTFPVGVPAPGLVTDIVAVKFTVCPYTDGFTSAPTLVVVPARFTVSDNTFDVLPLWFTSPLYTPLIA